MKLTVLITTYNCALYIEYAIKSILLQTFKDFELLIIDDGSTDNTEDVIDQNNDPRIRYIKREHFGRSASLNYGLQNASYDVVALMDADDISHPERLEKQIEIILGNENRVCYTQAAYFLESDYKIKFLSEETFHQVLNKRIALHGSFCNSTMMFYKNNILKYGYDETLPSSEDYDLLLRIKNISEFILIQDILLFARIRNKSLSSNTYKSGKSIVYKIQEPFYQNLSSSFEIDGSIEQWKLKGWREFYYGSKRFARKNWLIARLRNWNLKLTVAFLLSFFPEKFLEFIKNKRIRLRINYQIQRHFHRIKIQTEFNEICRMIRE